MREGRTGVPAYQTVHRRGTLGSAAGLALRSVLEGPMLEFAKPAG